MIPQWGRRRVLALGGIALFVLLLVMAVRLPESVRYMVARGAPAERIRARGPAASRCCSRARTPSTP
jgi:AAHS family 4-hydroxybenzoate transporter-like MFS transporter